MAEFQWFALAVNPEPWAIGDLSVGRKNGKMFPMVGRNNQLHMYKEAIKEELGDPGVWIDGKIELAFFFWRRRDDYKTPQARTHRKHEADLTNLQKATEDALQGILFKNDKDVAKITSFMIAQGAEVNSKVVIGIREFTGFIEIPNEVLVKIGELEEVESNEW